MQKGFSLIELLIVITVAFVLIGVSFFLLTSHQRLFKPDEQALKMADILQEARQRSLTQRETMRVEIDLTDNVMRLIDENSPTTHTDDQLIRQISLFPPQEVRVDSRPPGINFDPPEMIGVPPATFPVSVYPPSVAHNVCTLRFLRNGSVLNAGTDPIGSNASVVSTTIYIWSPKNGNPSQYEIARAITVVGTTGFIRLWEYDPNLTTPNKWRDSRRFSIGGN